MQTETGRETFRGIRGSSYRRISHELFRRGRYIRKVIESHSFSLFLFLIQDNRMSVTNWVLDTDYQTYAVRFSCYNTADKSYRELRFNNNKIPLLY